MIDECDRATIAGLKLAIIKTQTTKLECFIKLAERKKKFFNYSMILFILSGLTAVVDEIINFVFYSSNFTKY